MLRPEFVGGSRFAAPAMEFSGVFAFRTKLVSQVFRFGSFGFMRFCDLSFGCRCLIAGVFAIGSLSSVLLWLVRSSSYGDLLVSLLLCRGSICISELITIDPANETQILKVVKQQQSVTRGGIYEGSENYLRCEIERIGKHAVVIVGFGYDDKYKKYYWIIKNSYGRGWWVNGYGRIARTSVLPNKKPLIFATCYPVF
ncbi:Cysteine proteinase [Camellia lanceoleosa]|uniref:Cysteine proteinase n=1 Tax=Camellia lanceoleosa TaxID=1840588 RepID=A0ACC0H4G5_9ERIC|nr:Cysteine proteinase [Camellia lanceoleosa]